MELYLHSPNTPLWCGAWLDNFTFTFTEHLSVSQERLCSVEFVRIKCINEVAETHADAQVNVLYCAVGTFPHTFAVL
jgi:hypothetical protein